MALIRCWLMRMMSIYLIDNIKTVERNADVLLNACKNINLAVNIGKTQYMEVGRHRGMQREIFSHNCWSMLYKYLQLTP